MWKQSPQDQHLKGAKSGPNARPAHPVWLAAQSRGERIVKLIDYDIGKADLRRSKDLRDTDVDFEYRYPLHLVGLTKEDCSAASARSLGADWMPIKSACLFCAASRAHELRWLAEAHPLSFERALLLERKALTGRHSGFDAVVFGATWETLVRTSDRFPSSETTVCLGRSFAWNQWARLENLSRGPGLPGADPVS